MRGGRTAKDFRAFARSRDEAALLSRDGQPLHRVEGWPRSGTRELALGVNANFGADGTIERLEGASKLDLTTLEAQGVPMTTLKAAE